MCSRCDYDSPDNRIYVDPLTNEYYLDIETSEWDEYDDGFVHQKEYIAYCPLVWQEVRRKEKWCRNRNEFSYLRMMMLY